MPDEDRILLQTVARVIISDSVGTLHEQVDRRIRLDRPLADFVPLRGTRDEVPARGKPPSRELVLAKLELSLEALRDPAVGEVLSSWRARLVAVVDGMLTSADKSHSLARAEAMVASFDGLIVAALQKPVPERRAFLTESLTLVLHE